MIPLARSFATTASSSPAATMGPAMYAGAAALVTAAILYAPPNEFDDLDCQSYCQRYCVHGATSVSYNGNNSKTKKVREDGDAAQAKRALN